MRASKKKLAQSRAALKFNPNEKQEIQRVGQQGKQDFDELGRIYVGERGRQQEELEKMIAERQKQR